MKRRNDYSCSLVPFRLVYINAYNLRISVSTPDTYASSVPTSGSSWQSCYLKPLILQCSNATLSRSICCTSLSSFPPHTNPDVLCYSFQASRPATPCLFDSKSTITLQWSAGGNLSQPRISLELASAKIIWVVGENNALIMQGWQQFN